MNDKDYISPGLVLAGCIGMVAAFFLLIGTINALAYSFCGV